MVTFCPKAPEILERIQRGNHPDFLRISPVDDLINVDAIRALPRALSFAPLESSRRIVVLERADALNAQAANALLKILEEPPAHTVFFLLCQSAEDVLPTIRSRCQVMRFGPLDREKLLESLKDRVPPGMEDLVHSWSEGSAARAELLVQAEEGFTQQRQACEVLLDLWESSPRIPAATFLWVEGVVSDDNCQITVDSWQLLLRDLVFVAAGAGKDRLCFPDFYPRLKQLADGREHAVIDEAGTKSAAIDRFRVYRNFNGNLRLDFASLLTGIQVFSVGNAAGR